MGFVTPFSGQGPLRRGRVSSGPGGHPACAGRAHCTLWAPCGDPVLREAFSGRARRSLLPAGPSICPGDPQQPRPPSAFAAEGLTSTGWTPGDQRRWGGGSQRTPTARSSRTERASLRCGDSKTDPPAPQGHQRPGRGPSGPAPPSAHTFSPSTAPSTGVPAARLDGTCRQGMEAATF